MTFDLTYGHTDPGLFVDIFLIRRSTVSCHGYSPEHLGELSLAERHDDGEPDAGGDEVEQGGLRRERERVRNPVPLNRSDSVVPIKLPGHQSVWLRLLPVRV